MWVKRKVVLGDREIESKIILIKHEIENVNKKKNKNIIVNLT